LHSSGFLLAALILDEGAIRFGRRARFAGNAFLSNAYREEDANVLFGWHQGRCHDWSLGKDGQGVRKVGYHNDVKRTNLRVSPQNEMSKQGDGLYRPDSSW
jgi:hypothetical protein